MSEPCPPKLGTVMPFVWVRDVPAAVLHYTEKLGFELRFQKEWVYQERQSGMAILSRDGTEIQLWVCLCPDSRHDGLAYFGIEVEGVDALHAELTNKGVEILEELTAQEWGATDFTIEDPDGNRIEFYEFK